jgi:hypothetical protein
MTPDEIMEEIVQYAALLALEMGKDETAKWLEGLAIDILDMLITDGSERASHG